MTSSAVSGNIGSDQIQIDGSTNGADLYPGLGTPLNTGALQDWVKDATTNNGSRTVTDAVLTSGSATVTSASGAFLPGDVNATITGTGIPTGTTISAYTDANTITISSNATAGDGSTTETVTIQLVCLVDSVAVCNQIGVTAGSTKGHWEGVRVVDGVAQGDQDIFTKGGKENDTSTWLVGPGSVGSSKYDATQAYLANNSSNLYFGMERRGNNGTTAYDFEFNAEAPDGSTPTDCTSNPDPAYIPCRNDGDVLFTFEVSGSGSSGSVTPYVFKYDHTANPAYQEICGPDVATDCGTDFGIVTSTNNVPTPAAPWGYVNSHGNWVAGPTTMQSSNSCSTTPAVCLDRFEFAEVSVDLTNNNLFGGGIDACANSTFYTEVRTRSSATSTSDLKDTTKIFQYQFTAGSAPNVSKGTSPFSTDGDHISLTATADQGDTLQWQYAQTDPAGAGFDPATDWHNFGSNSSTASFNTWPSTSSATTFTATKVTGADPGSHTYDGVLFNAWVRVQATDSSNCTQSSTPLHVRKLVAVDP